jgi:hypothetical protein
MHFRATYLVRELAIRTVDGGVANTYEDSEADFYLGGPHEIAIEMRNASEDELPQPVAHEHHLVCQATGRWDPSSREIINEVTGELFQATRKVTGALRWRYGILGPHSPYAAQEDEWSFDAEQWHPLPSGMQLRVELGPRATVHVTPDVKADTEALLSSGVAESLGHELFREAWAIRKESPRSALVIGVAALEAGFKKFVADLVPEAAWLMENVQTPPLVPMLKNYLPTLPVKNTIGGEVLPPPKELRKTLRRSVEERNKVAHTGRAVLADEPLKERLGAIRDVLWLLDYYRGFEWALEHIRVETKQDMGL